MLKLSKITPTVAVALAATLSAFSPAATAENPFIIVQSTTSTQNSGLYDAILPGFTEQSGIDVRVVAVGTGQAIRNAKNCDGDVLLVHAKTSEEAFVEQGHGVSRTDVMYNDFVIVGPAADPASVTGMTDITAALTQIAKTQSAFASRGDDSGTHKAELRLWQTAGIDPTEHSGGWYRETGSGMGATLNVATGINAYVLTDRATWTSFENPGNSGIAVEGDDALFNQYGVILVNPVKCSNVKAATAQTFIDWILSVDGQAAIADYQIADQQLFFPNAPVVTSQ